MTAARQPTVLMIDDNPHDVDLTRMAFEENGFPVAFESAGDGEAGMRRVRELLGLETACRPRLVILDLNMPRLHGSEILGFLKAQPALRSIPVAVLTTSDSPLDRERCLALGAEHFITKSHDLDAFIESLRPLGAYLR